MAILFSHVTMSHEDYGTSEFFACGFPQDLDDLDGCIACEEYLEEIKGDATIDVHVEAFIYGEGQICWATPAELAYMIKRLEMDSDFLVSRCNNIGNHEFEIEWSEDELFGFGIE